jgi:hypothetical protein
MPETYPWDVESNRSACAVRVRCSCTLTPTDDGHATSARHGRRFGWLTPVRALPLALPARPLLGQLLFCPFHCGWHPHLLYSTSTSWERDDCFVLVPGCVRREPDALRCVDGRRHLFPVFHSWAVARSGGRKAAGTTGPRRLFFLYRAVRDAVFRGRKHGLFLGICNERGAGKPVLSPGCAARCDATMLVSVWGRRPDGTEII